MIVTLPGLRRLNTTKLVSILPAPTGGLSARMENNELIHLSEAEAAWLTDLINVAGNGLTGLTGLRAHELSFYSDEAGERALRECRKYTDQMEPPSTPEATAEPAEQASAPVTVEPTTDLMTFDMDLVIIRKFSVAGMTVVSHITEAGIPRLLEVTSPLELRGALLSLHRGGVALPSSYRHWLAQQGRPIE
jgi:hypothetical protein